MFGRKLKTGLVLSVLLLLACSWLYSDSNIEEEQRSEGSLSEELMELFIEWNSISNDWTELLNSLRKELGTQKESLGNLSETLSLFKNNLIALENQLSGLKDLSSEAQNLIEEQESLRIDLETSLKELEKLNRRQRLTNMLVGAGIGVTGILLVITLVGR